MNQREGTYGTDSYQDRVSLPYDGFAEEFLGDTPDGGSLERYASYLCEEGL